MDTLLTDLRFALRTLLRDRTFTAFTIATLGIGLGLNTALFSVINGVLLRPLPYSNPTELVDIRSRGETESFRVSLPNFVDWQAQSKSFARMAAYAAADINLSGQGDAERVSALVATSDFFDVLGVPAARGRTWNALESDADGAVISDALWRRQFGAASDIVGQTIVLNGANRTITGVMPAQFSFASADIWLRMPEAPQARRGNYNLSAVGRLKPGVMIEQAQQELGPIGKRLAEHYPNNGVGPTLQPLQQSLVGDARRPLLILLAAVGVVLLIACVNLASMTLARHDRRRRELAVRASLGAGRSRLIRQLLTEAAVSSLIAALVGVLLATWGTDVLLRNMPAALPRVADVHVDGYALAFTLLLAMVTAALFGLGPALRASVVTPATAMVEGGRGSTTGVQRRRALRILLVAELALALIPLAGAGVLLRSLDRLFSIDLGFRTRQVLTADYSLPQRTYGSAGQMAAYAERLIAAVRAVPGVVSAGVITPAPLSGDNQSASFEIEGRAPAGETPWSEIRAASPDYFASIGIPLKRGRRFDERDAANAPRVALIDETFARQFFASEDPIGKRIVLGFDREHPRQIVGIVGAIRDDAPNKVHEPHIYFPFAQQTLSSATLAVRASGDTRALTAAVRNAARNVDRDIPLYRLRTLQEAQREVLARSRFSALLFGLFALCALFMAAAGVYGVMSYWVAERRREIGIRLALGARPRTILLMIAGEGARLTALGLLLGLAGALASGRLLASMLFETSTFDLFALASVSAILGMSALSACLLPALRAARLDTLTVLTNG